MNSPMHANTFHTSDTGKHLRRHTEPSGNQREMSRTGDTVVSMTTAPTAQPFPWAAALLRAAGPADVANALAVHRPEQAPRPTSGALVPLEVQRAADVGQLAPVVSVLVVAWSVLRSDADWPAWHPWQVSTTAAGGDPAELGRHHYTDGHGYHAGHWQDVAEAAENCRRLLTSWAANLTDHQRRLVAAALLILERHLAGRPALRGAPALAGRVARDTCGRRGIHHRVTAELNAVPLEQTAAQLAGPAWSVFTEPVPNQPPPNRPPAPRRAPRATRAPAPRPVGR